MIFLVGFLRGLSHHLEICHSERTYGDFLGGGMLIVDFCLSTDIANGRGGGG